MQFLTSSSITKVIRGVSVPYISEHISFREADGDGDGKIKILRESITLFERVRDSIKKPIFINSYHREQWYQDHLRNLGYPAAKVSTHSFGCAYDLSLPRGYTAEDLRDEFIKAACELEIPEPRFGYKKYKHRFLHVDIAPMLVETARALGVNENILKNWLPGVVW